MMQGRFHSLVLFAGLAVTVFTGFFLLKLTPRLRSEVRCGPWSLQRLEVHRSEYGPSLRDYARPIEWSVPQYKCPLTWLEDYAAWHHDVMQGNIDEGYRVALYSLKKPRRISGLGDRFRAMMLTLTMSALFKRVLLIDWKAEERNVDLLNQIFVPTTIQWNVTDIEVDASILKFANWSTDLDEASTVLGFLKNFTPVGMTRRKVEAAEKGWLSRPDRMQLKSPHVVPSEKVRDLISESSEWNSYMMGLTEPPLKFASDENLILYGGTNFDHETLQLVYDEANRTTGVNQSEIASQILGMSDWELHGCTFSFMFNEITDLQRNFYFWLLVGVAEDYRRNLHLSFWPQPKSEAVPVSCVGKTFSQCMNQKMPGIQMPPIVGIHFRSGDQALNLLGIRDRRNSFKQFSETLRCAMRLGEMLGFERYVFLLETDCTALAAAAPRISEEIGVPIVVPRPRNAIQHTRKTRGKGAVVNHLDAMASILVLASADALVLTKSGFGRMAWFLSGIDESQVAIAGWRGGTSCDLPSHQDRWKDVRWW